MRVEERWERKVRLGGDEVVGSEGDVEKDSMRRFWGVLFPSTNYRGGKTFKKNAATAMPARGQNHA